MDTPNTSTTPDPVNTGIPDPAFQRTDHGEGASSKEQPDNPQQDKNEIHPRGTVQQEQLGKGGTEGKGGMENTGTTEQSQGRINEKP